MGFSRNRLAPALCVAALAAACSGHRTSAPARPPARSTTTGSVTTRAPRTTTSVEDRQPDDNISNLPGLAFGDRVRGWRVDPSTDEGTIDGTSDGGRTWSAQFQLPADGDSVNGVAALGPTDAYAIVTSCCDGSKGRLLRTRDGVHWTPTAGFGLSAPLELVSFSDAQDAWGLTRYGDVVLTHDGGDHWHVTTRPPGTSSFGGIGSVCTTAPRSGWLATGQSVYRSDDDGATWQRQLTIPVMGSTPTLACRGAHVAYSSFDVGAGQHIGAFVRSDDGGAHWRPLTEDDSFNGPTLDAPGFPDDQYRGDPVAMQRDGTLLFTTGSGRGENWVVTASASDRFHVAHFDSAASQQIILLAATAVDPMHLFVETQTIFGDGTGPRPVFLYASDDGGRTWHLRWQGQ